jgi:hypothetical protein
MRITFVFALGLLCGSCVSGFFQGGVLLKKASMPRVSCHTALKSGKSVITARHQTEAIDRRSLLIGTIFSVVISLNKKALAAESEEQFTAALLELSNQAPYEDKAVAFLSDGSPSFALAQAAFTKLGGTVVSIDPKKSVTEIQKLYKDGNCIGAFVTDEKVLKNIMQGRGCECERCCSWLAFQLFWGGFTICDTRKLLRDCRCGIGGSQTGPSWVVVLGKTSKSGQQIEAPSPSSPRCVPRRAHDFRPR